MSGLHRDQLDKTTSQIVSLTISGNICKVTTTTALQSCHGNTGALMTHSATMIILSLVPRPLSPLARKGGVARGQGKIYSLIILLHSL